MSKSLVGYNGKYVTNHSLGSMDFLTAWTNRVEIAATILIFNICATKPSLKITNALILRKCKWWYKDNQFSDNFLLILWTIVLNICFIFVVENINRNLRRKKKEILKCTHFPFNKYKEYCCSNLQINNKENITSEMPFYALFKV